MKTAKRLTMVGVMVIVWLGLSTVAQSEIVQMVGINQELLTVFEGYVNVPAGSTGKVKFAAFEIQEGDQLFCTLHGTMVHEQKKGISGCSGGMLANSPVVDLKYVKYPFVYDFINIFNYMPCKVVEETHSKELMEAGKMKFILRDAIHHGGPMYVKLTILRTRPESLMDQMPKPIWENNENIFQQISR